MKKRILSILILLNLALIWGNSLMPGQVSGEMSGGIVAWLGNFLPFFSTEAGHHFLRKAAHFSEFCLLGIHTGTRRALSGKDLKLTGAGYGLAAACIDETIQVYVPGRGSSLLDVWIDTAGFATGLLIAMLGHRIRTKHNRND